MPGIINCAEGETSVRKKPKLIEPNVEAFKMGLEIGRAQKK